MSALEPSEIPDADSRSYGALQPLMDAVAKHKAVVSCGGSIPINADLAFRLGAEKEPVSAPPVVIRWSSGSDSLEGHAMELPPKAGAADGVEHHEPADISRLLRDCESATFGLGGENVLDESYRKAAKMDNTMFCTNFHPHDYGIIDAIARALLPNIEIPRSEKDTYSSHLRVVAELYKLNIYSGPSGKFKAHVDTPRSDRQFGSLVVCLPYPHEGGQLVIRHQGHEIIHDWSKTSASKIGWAAFYSDCEHEVLEVKAGHRITLTYNLYASSRASGNLDRFPGINPAKYPLYGVAKSLLSDPGFMENGGTLGFWCEHRYAHTSGDAADHPPFTLKGVDIAIYSIFRSLGLHVKTRPILNKNNFSINWDEEESDGPEEDFVGNRYHQLNVTNYFYDGDEPYLDFARRHWKCKPVKGIVWMNNPKHWEVAFVNPAYGNEPEIKYFYSTATILIEVPDFATRSQEENAVQETQG